MNIAKQIRAAGCACPRAAGVTAGYQTTGYMPPPYMTIDIVSQGGLDPWQDQPESYWPVGSRAYLVEPYAVDTGYGNAPKMVSVFEKKSNGRWLSMPGQDISFSSLYQLMQYADVVRVEGPGGINTEPPPPAPSQAGPEGPAPEPDRAMDPITGDVPDAPDPGADAGGAERPFHKTPGGMAAIGGGVLALIAGGALLAWYLS